MCTGFQRPLCNQGLTCPPYTGPFEVLCRGKLFAYAGEFPSLCQRASVYVRITEGCAVSEVVASVCKYSGNRSVEYRIRHIDRLLSYEIAFNELPVLHYCLGDASGSRICFTVYSKLGIDPYRCKSGIKDRVLVRFDRRNRCGGRRCDRYVTGLVSDIDISQGLFGGDLLKVDSCKNARKTDEQKRDHDNQSHGAFIRVS